MIEVFDAFAWSLLFGGLEFTVWRPGSDCTVYHRTG